MYISKFTDYAFRVLVYLATNNERLCTVDEIAKNLSVSENHMKKIVHRLAKGDFIKSTKGRSGGIKLAFQPEEINLASVIIYCDEISNVMDCKKDSTICCYFVVGCKLKKIIDDAVSSFSNEFKKYTLKDLLK